MQRTAEEKFWSRVDKGQNPGGCWLWTAHKDRKGYGQFYVQRKGNERAHRVAYMLSVGAIPAGLCVLHRCDNPPCVNPDHLFLGTNADNIADRVAKGRTASGSRNGANTKPETHATGERHGCAKLTWEAVAAIRLAHADGVTRRELAARFGVVPTAISKIVLRQRWVRGETNVLAGS